MLKMIIVNNRKFKLQTIKQNKLTKSNKFFMIMQLKIVTKMLLTVNIVKVLRIQKVVSNIQMRLTLWILYQL